MTIRDDLKAAAEAIETGHATEDDPEILGEEDTETDVDQEAPEEEEDVVNDGQSEEVNAELQTSVDDDDPLPSTWSAEMREHWKSTPKNVREYIQKRERQQHDYISRTGSELGRLRKEYSEVETALKPYENILKEKGVSKGSVITRMIQEREEMSKNPRQFIKRLADSHALDLLDLAMDDDQAEPKEVRQARYEFEQQRAQIEAQKGQIESERELLHKNQLTTYIEAWGSQRPHFNQVRQAMAQILPQIQEDYAYMSFGEQLDTAYNVILQHPNFQYLTRSVPESARKAASGISGQSGVPTRQPEPSSIREALMQAAKETGFF
jgi:hypothetical protein